MVVKTVKLILIWQYPVTITCNTQLLIVVDLDQKPVLILAEINPLFVAHGILTDQAQLKDATAVAYLQVLSKMVAICLANGDGRVEILL